MGSLKKKERKPLYLIPPAFVALVADQVAKTLVKRLPSMISRPRRKKETKNYKIENGIFLDTSAIIDGRIFEVIGLGLLTGIFVVLENILLELKHIADSKDPVKRERGRRGLELLEKLKKSKGVKLVVYYATEQKMEVDEHLIHAARKFKGRIITCDYNLEKKAAVNGVVAINVNTLANSLKVTAVPGETLNIAIIHVGKDPSQGVGYLDDGTMIVVESGALDVGKKVDVVVSRVIQTTAGRILFAKKF